MSFWFAKKAKAPSKARGPTGKPSAPKGSQAQAAVLNRLGCQACPLTKGGIKQAPSLAKHTEVYFLGEAEDETGEINSVLRSCIDNSNYRLCTFDNVINCQPNKAPAFTEIECCRPRRINFIEQAKPRVIVGLGTVPLQAMLGSTDMVGLRGRLFAVKVGKHKCWFLPTYDPTFIEKQAYDKKKPLQSRMGHCFRMDISRVFDLLRDLEPPENLTEADVRGNIQCFDGTDPKHFDQVCHLLDETRKAPIKAVDIETKGLRPYRTGNDIMSIAFSFGITNFSFAWKHPKAGWTKIQLGVFESLLLQILADNTIKIAHNAPFEIEWFIWLLSLSVVNHTSWECTMMQAHFLDERKGKYREEDVGANRYQGLDFLINQHFGIKFKGLFKLNKKDMSQSDLGEILIYNGADTKLTLMLYHRQFKQLKAEKLLEAYRDSVLRQPTVALMQHLGVPVSQKAVRAARKRLRPRWLRYKGLLNHLKVVRQYKKDHGSFNWQSGKDVIAIYRDYLKRKEINVVNSAGATRVTVDKNVLAQIKHPLSTALLGLREVDKLRSTYVDKMRPGDPRSVVYPDGKMHPSFLTTSTETGRTASEDPNAQNYPKRKNSWIRNQVRAPKKHLFVAIDYGQLEACTGAMCSRDKYLTKALWEDFDIHMVWAEKFAAMEPRLVNKDFSKASMKNFRSLIKNKMVFPAFFGATNESVHGYLVNTTGVDLNQSDVDDKMAEFWDTFNGMGKWQKQTMQDYYNRGFVATMSGRKHRYPLTKNQAVNMPIQGTAAELVCDAMCRLSDIALSTDQMHLHPIMNIHDDISYFLPDDDKILEDSLEVIIKEMLTFDFSWINVPLSVEVSVGPNWADVEPIGKFWSHKLYGYPAEKWSSNRPSGG